MAALLLIALVVFVSSCRPRRTVEQHCNLRQDLWEAAYAKDRPSFVAQTRKAFVNGCTRRFGLPGTEEDFRCRDDCLEKVPRGAEPGTQAAKDAYKVLQKCEAVCPGQYCIAQPTW